MAFPVDHRTSPKCGRSVFSVGETGREQCTLVGDMIILWLLVSETRVGPDVGKRFRAHVVNGGIGFGDRLTAKLYRECRISGRGNINARDCCSRSSSNLATKSVPLLRQRARYVVKPALWCRGSSSRRSPNRRHSGPGSWSCFWLEGKRLRGNTDHGDGVH
jgi:hypothetical protein